MAIDWDEWLSYSTVKLVKIRERRLGLLHYIFMVVIVLYVAGYTVIYNKTYMITEKPVGSIRLSLLQGADVKNVTQLPYCLYNNHTSIGKFPNQKCVFWDESFVLYPETEEYSMFATTRVTITNQSVNCSMVDDSTCEYQDDSTDVYYIGDIEHFTVLIDHSIYAPHVGVEANARDLHGELLNQQGKVVQLDKPSVVGVGSSDILEIQTLLDAAGVPSLDSASGTNSSISLRYDGIVLIVFLSYTNTYTYDLGKIKYSISAATISNTKFKSVQPIFTKNWDTRVLWNRHGLRMIFLQEGELGKFDFQTLLLSFVAGLGLITVSTVIVDIIAFYIVSSKQTYIEHRYEVAEDPKHKPGYLQVDTEIETRTRG